jgi:DNA-binding NtrC family response regulator
VLTPWAYLSKSHPRSEIIFPEMIRRFLHHFFLEDNMKIQHRNAFEIRTAFAHNDLDDVIIGDSQAAHSLRQMAELAATSDSPMLITGPYGSEKLCIARAIHSGSNRAKGQFLRINCGVGMSDPSFADQGLETSHNGTLFLEDADEMSVDVQMLIWQLISNHQPYKLPGQEAPPLNIRVIAATNQCLAAKVKEGLFRSDLYSRLSLMSLPIGPLQQRRVDVEAMINHFLLAHDPAKRFTIDWAARQVLRGHSWPGNVRELRQLVARACIFHPGQNIGSRGMKGLLAMGNPPLPSVKVLPAKELPFPFGANFNLKTYLRDEEARYVQSALAQANGIIQHAADMMGMKRTTFVEKMRKHGIERKRFRV